MCKMKQCHLPPDLGTFCWSFLPKCSGWVEQPELCWVGVVESGHFFFSWSERKIFKLLTIEDDVSVGLSYMGLIMLRYVPSITNFWEIFVMKDDKFCPVLFLHLWRWILFSVLLTWGTDGEPSLHLRDTERNHDVWYFQCTMEFSVLIFCW